MRVQECVLALALLISSAIAPVHAVRDQCLVEAWKDPDALRSVFLVEEMTCRACTMILDRHLNREEGIYWARFNYPLRLLVVHHDPRKVPADALEDFVDRSEEFRAVHLGSSPAWGFRSGKAVPVASWSGGSFSPGQASRRLEPFLPVLWREFGDHENEEKTQAAYEILGEMVRTEILAAAAAAERKVLPGRWKWRRGFTGMS